MTDGTVVIVAYKTPQGRWLYRVRYGMKTRLFRKLQDANAWAALKLASGRYA
jgi:hypothetical protein